MMVVGGVGDGLEEGSREGAKARRATLYRGDCLRVLPGLADESVDAVVTDPPYLIGAISCGGKKSKSGTWPDILNAAYWFAEWYRQCFRVLRPTGYLATFCNWRTLPTVLHALSICRMKANSCLVWDKGWIGPAAKNQLRPRHEMVIFAGNKEAEIENRAIPDIVTFKWQGHMKKYGHPAEKPEALLSYILAIISPEGGITLDPFMGVGTCGVATVNEGSEYIGIEADAEYFEIAQARIAAAGAEVVLG